MITVIDSGISNIGSVLAACRRIGVAATATTDARTIAGASALLLPGVGAFADGMSSLRRHDLVQPIRDAAAARVPILGICLGMQLLAEASEEFGDHEGLGIVAGRVVRLQPANGNERVPNIGWCDVSVMRDSRLFAGIGSGAAFYFVHSFRLKCADPKDSVGTISFGGDAVCVAVERANIFGAQFHPEKSQDAGLRFLYNFATISAAAANHPLAETVE